MKKLILTLVLVCTSIVANSQIKIQNDKFTYGFTEYQIEDISQLDCGDYFITCYFETQFKVQDENGNMIDKGSIKHNNIIITGNDFIVKEFYSFDAEDWMDKNIINIWNLQNEQ